MCLKLPNLYSFAVLIALLPWSTGFSQTNNPTQAGHGPASQAQSYLPVGGLGAGVAPDSANLLLAAAKAQGGRRSVAARIRQTVHLFGQELIGSGVYLEQDSTQGLLFRLELRLQLEPEEQPSSLLQVCDGRYLWKYRMLGGGESLTRVDVVRVAQILEESGQMPRMRSLAKWPTAAAVPMMLAGLAEAFDFSAPQEVSFQSPRGPIPAWRIEGRWADSNELPPHLPNRVEVFLGREDLFPRRIAYYRFDSSEAGIAKTARPVMAIDLLDVCVNVPINPARFAYRPGDIDVHDATNDYLRELGVQ